FLMGLYSEKTNRSLHEDSAKVAIRRNRMLFRIGRCFGFIVTALFVPLLFSLGPIKTGQAVLSHHFVGWFCFAGIVLGILFQGRGLFVLFVHFQDFQHLIFAQGVPCRGLIFV